MCLSGLGLVVYGGLLLCGGFAAGVVVTSLLATAKRADVVPCGRRPWEG